MNDNQIAWRVFAAIVGIGLLAVGCQMSKPDTVTCTGYGNTVTCDRS